MKTKFTPGPWQTSGRFGQDVVGNNAFTHVAYTITYKSDVGPETQVEQKANARLIAAAPELLEVLKWIQREFSKAKPDPDFTELHVKLFQAMAKAEGTDK